jgi:hypothetical protein
MRVLGQMVLGLTLFAAQPALSQSEDHISGNFFLPHCRAFIANRTPNVDLLEGYCAGVVFGMASIGDLYAPELKHCIPLGVKVGQEVMVVIQYLDANPAMLHLDFRLLVLMAFKAAWPCN